MLASAGAGGRLAPSGNRFRCQRPIVPQACLKAVPTRRDQSVACVPPAVNGDSAALRPSLWSCSTQFRRWERNPPALAQRPVERGSRPTAGPATESRACSRDMRATVSSQRGSLNGYSRPRRGSIHPTAGREGGIESLESDRIQATDEPGNRARTTSGYAMTRRRLATLSTRSQPTPRRYGPLSAPARIASRSISAALPRIHRSSDWRRRFTSEMACRSSGGTVVRVIAGTNAVGADVRGSRIRLNGRSRRIPGRLAPAPRGGRPC